MMSHRLWKLTFNIVVLLSLLVGIAPAHVTFAYQSPPPQATENIYTIKLRSREFTPEPGLSPQERMHLRRAARAAAGQGRSQIHVLIQLYDIPTPAERAALAEQGIHLFTYIHNHAWVAAIPSDDLDNVVATPNVRWLGELQVNDKLAPDIRAEEFGAWNYDPDRDTVAVIVQVHDDLSLDAARDAVLDNGGMVRGYVRSINSVVAEIPRNTLRKLGADDRVLWVETVLPPLTPENDGGREALNVDILHPSPYNDTPTYNLDGTDIDVLVYDGGRVDNNHPDFGMRVTHGDTTDIADHATHVAGTLGGDGTQSAIAGGTNWQWRGVAPNVNIISYGSEGSGSGLFFITDTCDINNDWNSAKNTHGADLGTVSLGLHIASTFLPCDLMGNYGQTSQLMDNIVRGSLGEPYIATWSAGNERRLTGGCGQYHTVNPPKCAKNLIVVGATNSNDNSMTTFSSWGPCDDGRLRPVIVAPGDENNGCTGTNCRIRSTVADRFIDSRDRNCINNPSDPNDKDDFCFPYDIMRGTSMATPAVAGVIVLMLQQYRDTYNTGGEFLPSTAKALLINTAADLGNVGPDYQHGYGHVNAQAAVDAVINGLFREATIEANGEVDWYAIQVSDVTTQLQVSLAWDDPAVAPLTTSALVNDLDLVLVDPEGGAHRSWTLDPTRPQDPATRTGDNINNQEQVTVDNPASGTWRVHVAGITIPDSPQPYSLAATHNMISLDITEPTRATPINVGYYANPEKLLISLDLRDRQGELGTTIDTTTDLSIQIGEESPAGVYPGGTVGGRYWVLLTPPAKSEAGCYDLEVRLFDVVNDIEANAVCYNNTATSAEDIMLVIDSSGSMSWNGKMSATQSAAKFFVTATGLGDMIGMDTFSTTAALKYPLTTVAGAATKDAANAAIDALVARGETALGSGAQIANSELTTNGGTSHGRTMIILSDGNENKEPMWADIVDNIPDDTVIHTIALGPDGDPDEALLSDIAADFNGNYYRVPTASSGSLQRAPNTANLIYELNNRLANVYRLAAEEIYGWERLWEVNHVPSYHPYYSHTIYIEPNLEEVIFAGRSGDNIMPYLWRPDGALVLRNDPDVLEYRNILNHWQYRILSPPDGLWTLDLVEASGSSLVTEYMVRVEARSQIELFLLSPRPGQHIGYCQDVPILTTFVGPSQPVLGAQVHANLIGPLTWGNVMTVTLYDDGNHGDGQAADGWYGNTFNPCLGLEGPPPLGIGSYQIKITAAGTNEDTIPVTRTTTSAYYATGSTTGDPDPPPAQILLVDDDEDAPNVRNTYITPLNNLGVAYDIWDIVNDGPPAAGNLTPYHTVIWFTGEDLTGTLEAENEVALTDFLDSGGKLFLSSQHYLYDAGAVNAFMENSLHISAAQNDVGASSVQGVLGNPMSDGLGPYTLSSLAEYADKLTPKTPGGQSALVNDAGATIAVNFTDGNACSFFAAFPFERLATSDAEELLQHILDWKCWDPNIQVTPSAVGGQVCMGPMCQSIQTVAVANPGQGKLAWTVNRGPVHLWAITDADGELPAFLNTLDPADMRLDVCTLINGVSDCCTGANCTTAELLNQDVVLIYNNQPFATPTELGDMLADFVDQGGTVIITAQALIQGSEGLSGRFMDQMYSPLKSISTTIQGTASLDTYDDTHPLMNGVSSADVFSHLDVSTTGNDVDVIASWDTGEPFIAIKRLDPAPIAGRVIAINAPIDDGEWNGEVNTVVINAVQWLASHTRDLPWLNPVCSISPPPPLYSEANTRVVATSIDYTCPLVNSGNTWNMQLTFDGSTFAPTNVMSGTVLHGKVIIEHNVAEQERVNIPISAMLTFSKSMVTAVEQVKSVTPSSETTISDGDLLTYTIVISAEPSSTFKFYDPLDGPVFVDFIKRPPGITHTTSPPNSTFYLGGILTGTVTVMPGHLITVSYVARADIPDTADAPVTLANRACTYPVSGDLDDCTWSNEVVSLIKPRGAELGTPSATVIYHVPLTNTDTISHTFIVSFGGNQWPVVVPATIGPVVAGGSTAFSVTVSAPAATGGMLLVDTVALTLTSVSTPAKSATLSLRTRIFPTGVDMMHTLYLPLVLRNK